MNTFWYKHSVKVSVLFCTVFFSLTVLAKIQPRDAYVATSAEYAIYGGTYLLDEIPLNTPIEFQNRYIDGRNGRCFKGESLPGKTSPIDPDGSHGQSTYWKAWWLFQYNVVSADTNNVLKGGSYKMTVQADVVVA
ncbi:hypothetical protein M8Q70_001154 [Salmonella enterica]|uniref:Fimbrial protein n=1 Tax=Salmonella enterica TaxID=28901 RepID=A0A379SHR4_SALER|nr:hypothetical protein [Salmonella enterica]ECC9556688.1 hypothetical protein [Salmonella enterica subsp. salamae]ECH1486088.1 hypothetical protein [Salmonella enterica subsp. enterica serovar Bredeney]EDU6783875.1 hypothetical protein [Salmonella enterica subsp. enterica serovar Gaminara]EEJ8785192.1 hypothetical protein [Salmonella enterica subsp. enterica]EGT2786543.1 hypothetical protein [Salmonella enterica subsp. enterica serovar Carmel]